MNTAKLIVMPSVS